MTPAKPMPLPPWPERLRFPVNTAYVVDIEAAYLHERALASAWEARARLAVDLLEELKGGSMSERWTREQVTEALTTIGPLPALPLPAPPPAPLPEGTGE